MCDAATRCAYIAGGAGACIKSFLPEIVEQGGANEVTMESPNSISLWALELVCDGATRGEYIAGGGGACRLSFL